MTTTPAPAAGPDYLTPQDGPPAPHQADVEAALAADTARARADGVLSLARQLEEVRLREAQREEVHAQLARRVVALSDQVARVEALLAEWNWWTDRFRPSDRYRHAILAARNDLREALHPSSPTLDTARTTGDPQEGDVDRG